MTTIHQQTPGANDAGKSNFAGGIAIIGGGPGGLTLARLLHVAGISSTVFERDAGPHERPQGGTLDLHADSGLLALEQAGLIDGFSQIARYDDQGTRLLDMAGKLLFEDDDAAAGNRPEVDRTALRDLLLGSLPQGCVRWGSAVHEVVHEVVSAADGKWLVRCAEGDAGPFDLVVGADGAWSRVRPLLSRYAPQYSGLTFIEFGIDQIDTRHPHLAKLVGPGKMGVEGAGKGMIVQRNGNSHVRGYAIFRVPPEWAGQRFDFADPASVRQALIDEFAGYAEVFLDLIRACNDRIVTRPIVGMPVGHHWPHKPGLTLIGDAAHVMSPFGGEGVNNAMLDALELAHCLTTDGDVAVFEEAMFARIEESAAHAAEAAATHFSHMGEELTLAVYRGHQEDRKAELAPQPTKALRG